MLRYTMLKRFAEASDTGDLKAGMPHYNDGHVRIDRDAVAGLNQEPGDGFRWPGNLDEDSWPGFERTTEYAPAVITEMIDCRSLTQRQTLFVLMMTGAWKRRSKYMLDFDTPRLSAGIVYRSDHVIDMIGWLQADAGQQQLDMPAPLSSADAWGALAAYVGQNRLFNQFSTALYLVCGAMCQMLPATAEGQLWLTREVQLKIPQFKSVRGRFPFFNEGEAALLNHRALQEWSYINNTLERIALMGSIMAQAYQTGLAIRNIRLNIEEEPRDIYTSKLAFQKMENHYSAAMAEALRIPVPLSGMSEAYIYYSDEFDGRLADSWVQTVTPFQTPAPGYESVERRNCHCLRVWTLPMAGVPTLLLPLDSFPGLTPFALKGELDGDSMHRNKFGWHATPYQAWHWAWAARLCGYDVEISSTHMLEGAKRPYAPNESSWTWPLMVTQASQGEKLTISKLRERPNHFIELPLVHSKFFTGKLKFSFTPMHHLVTDGDRTNSSEICEFHGYANALGVTNVKIDVPAGVQLLRGYIARADQDFQFVNAVQGGLIPPAPEVIPVLAAVADPAPG